MENIELERINENLESLKKMLFEIKKNMVHEDSFLTQEENIELNESISRYKKGQTKILKF
jgi:cob(I)alamin adenosyltransferase